MSKEKKSGSFFNYILIAAAVAFSYFGAALYSSAGLTVGLKTTPEFASPVLIMDESELGENSAFGALGTISGKDDFSKNLITLATAMEVRSMFKYIVFSNLGGKTIFLKELPESKNALGKLLFGR